MELIEFSAHQFGEFHSQLIWHTGSEINSEAFYIQRTFNLQIQTWETISTQKAAGQSTQLLEYSYVDKHVPSAPGFRPTTYYRLKMVDQDGSFEYSPIRPVTFEGQQMVEVFPNPTRQEATLRINSDTPEEAWVRIIGSHGKQVVEQRLSVSSGITEATIDCRHLPGGSYWIQVKGKTIDFCGKLILMKD